MEDHLAQMSRRLVEEVRDERYGSAHMVAERVRRELDEPLRRAAMELTALETLLAVGSDEARARAQIAAELEEIAEISRRLQTLPARPSR